MPTTLLASGLADKIGEQDKQLRVQHAIFAKVGGCKLCGLRSQNLGAKPDWESLGRRGE